MSVVKFLETVDDFEQLRREVLSLVSNYRTEDNQIILQTDVPDVTNWYAGTGSLRLLNKEEKSFVHIQPELTGSVIEKFIKKYNAYRSRIMTVSSRKCYSIHSDPSYRIHIPIETNLMSYMVWPMESIVYKFDPQNVYWTDTKKMHTFFNGGTSERIHLVLCTDYVPDFDS